MLLGKRTSKAEVRDLHIAAVQRVQDIIRLDISVQHVVLVHLAKAKRRFVKIIAAKVLRILMRVV